MSDQPDEPTATRPSLAAGAQRALRAARTRSTEDAHPAAVDDASVEDATVDDATTGEATTDDPATDSAPPADDTTRAGADDVDEHPPTVDDDASDDDNGADTGADDAADTGADDAADTGADDAADAGTEATPAEAEEPADDATATRPSVATDDTPPEAPRGLVRTAKAPRAARAPATTRPPRRRISRFTAVGSGVLLLALVFAVVSFVIWSRADGDGERTAALARDDVAVSARLAIATVNTSDYRQPANALSNWLDVSTGTLHSQFSDSRASATKLLAQAKTVTSATVLDAAVTKLDADRGTATVIASVNVKRKPVTGAATTSRNRFRATMTEVGGEWKLDDLKILEAQLV